MKSVKETRNINKTMTSCGVYWSVISLDYCKFGNTYNPYCLCVVSTSANERTEFRGIEEF